MDPRPQCYIPRPKVTGPLVPEKKIFEGFLPYMGVVAILVMWPRCPNKLTFPRPIEAPHISGFDWPSDFREEDFWKWWTDNDDDEGGTTEHAYTISSSMSLKKGSGELKTDLLIIHKPNLTSSHFKNHINGPWKSEIELVRAFMPVLIICNFDNDLIKNEWASMETQFSLQV